MIRALSVLASTFGGDVRACERERIAGVDVLVARPRRSGPVVVYANAATPLGVEQPMVGRFLSALAGAGFVAVAPELPRVRMGEVTPETIDALVGVARTSGPRVALIGASTGAGLVILAAADPRLADRVTTVASISPFASLRNVLELATTGSTEVGRTPRRRSSRARRHARSLRRHPTIPRFFRSWRTPMRHGSTTSTQRSHPRRVRSSRSSRRSRGSVPSRLRSRSPRHRTIRSSRSRSHLRLLKRAAMSA